MNFTIENNLIVKDPAITFSCTFDESNSTANVQAVFTGKGYSHSRRIGYFDGLEKWKKVEHPDLNADMKDLWSKVDASILDKIPTAIKTIEFDKAVDGVVLSKIDDYFKKTCTIVFSSGGVVSKKVFNMAEKAGKTGYAIDITKTTF